MNSYEVILTNNVNNERSSLIIQQDVICYDQHHDKQILPPRQYYQRQETKLAPADTLTISTHHGYITQIYMWLQQNARSGHLQDGAVALDYRGKAIANIEDPLFLQTDDMINWSIVRNIVIPFRNSTEQRYYIDQMSVPADTEATLQVAADKPKKFPAGNIRDANLGFSENYWTQVLIWDSPTATQAIAVGYFRNADGTLTNQLTAEGFSWNIDNGTVELVTTSTSAPVQDEEPGLPAWGWVIIIVLAIIILMLFVWGGWWWGWGQREPHVDDTHAVLSHDHINAQEASRARLYKSDGSMEEITTTVTSPVRIANNVAMNEGDSIRDTFDGYTEIAGLSELRS